MTDLLQAIGEIRSLERRNAELTARVAELEQSHRRQSENYVKLYDAVMGDGVRTSDFADPIEAAQALHAAVAEARKDGQWQPIETAPKDGTLVLIFEADFKAPRLARFDRELWRGDGYKYEATHWMPLPAMPLPEPKEGK